MVTKKEKKEIGLILGSVLIVAVVGMITTNTAETTVGQATKLAVTTYSGMITLLNEYCEPVENTGTCETTCTMVDKESGPPLDPDDDVCLCCSVN